ncbi:PREDICTED: endogenous retrovirus group K member 18 Pol protein-like [Rhagoletis zephyria]|uniref:endogenous retrovirus group K member 18 Pol protein-like n=1 Tax=Rhagoletis zephyria TaxID=28612 RepID=UPI0008117A2A|nr:PREDICTED: endogenous retrovirus group K member 18 Pol protein-like [Rhagoletis zephyria]
MRKATAHEVIKYLQSDVFHVFGVPEAIHSDNGTQFISESFGKFLQGYGVKHVKTVPYAPQANALEQVNRSPLAMIRTYLSEEDHRTWDQHVSHAAFALRSAVHEAIGLEPYKAIFG